MLVFENAHRGVLGELLGVIRGALAFQNHQIAKRSHEQDSALAPANAIRFAAEWQSRGPDDACRDVSDFSAQIAATASVHSGSIARPVSGMATATAFTRTNGRRRGRRMQQIRIVCGRHVAWAFILGDF